MKSTMLLVYATEYARVITGKNKINNIANSIKRLFKRSAADAVPREIMIGDAIKMIILDMPWSEKGVSLIRVDQIKRFIRKIQNRYDIQQIFLPDSIHKMYKNEWEDAVKLREDLLMRALLIDFLKHVFGTLKKNLYLLDIAVVIDQEDDTLRQIFQLYSPAVKCITIGANSKIDVQKTVDWAFEEYGLPVYVSADLKAIVKQADLIINLKKETQYLSVLKKNSHTMVIDLVSQTKNYYDTELVIKGFQIKLPKEIETLFGKEIQKYYHQKRFALMLLQTMMGGYRKVEDPFIEDEFMQFMNTAFWKYGFGIGDIMGRHGIIKKEEIDNLIHRFTQKKQIVL